MTAESILLIVGVVLIFVAGLGLMRRRRSPAASRPGALVLSGAGAGALCIAAGIILVAGSGVARGPVRVTIQDDGLGAGVISEAVSVTIDGRHVGVLRIDRRSQDAKLTVRVDRTGEHPYALVVTRRAVGHAPVVVRHAAMVEIDGHSRLSVYAADPDDYRMGP